MRLQKHLQGFVVFLTVLISIICIYEYLYGPLGYGPFLRAPRVKEPVSVTEPMPSDAPAVDYEAQQPLDYDVRLVSLDFINGKSYTTLTLKLRPGQPAPEKLLVKTRFYVPGGAENQSWESTVGITRPTAEGGRVEVTAVSACYWCARSDAPKAGYFADVYVSAQYEGRTYPPDSFDIPFEAMIPVVVQAGRGVVR